MFPFFSKKALHNAPSSPLKAPRPLSPTWSKSKATAPRTSLAYTTWAILGLVHGALRLARVDLEAKHQYTKLIDPTRLTCMMHDSCTTEKGSGQKQHL